MNDKIKELTKKAFMLAHEANDMHEQEEGEEFSETEFDNVFNQKFAELVIRECMEVAYEYDGCKLSGPGMLIANDIEEHFGIKQ